MDGGGRSGSRRAGRINKRGAPPSHLRHLYFAAPHGRKSSSVSEIPGGVARGRVKRGVGSAAGKGSRPPLAQRSSLTLSRTIRLSDNDRATGEITKLGDEGVIFLEINF
jgi:hypothetical protein